MHTRKLGTQGITVSAHAVHPISVLEIEYSVWTRDIEDEVLPVLREIGVGVLAYGALSRGLLTGSVTETRQLSPKDFRRHIPRFQGANLQRNQELENAL